ncbi:hypothetical protein HJC99_04285 [Candidatus Saccharibacteria bacterium]|nr:hypothetical protein [Candidatus Saccharibacteria bacterium]
MQQITVPNRDELWALLPYVRISYGDRTDIETDELRRVLGEVHWGEYITGYQQVTGRDISDEFKRRKLTCNQLMLG